MAEPDPDEEDEMSKAMAEAMEEAGEPIEKQPSEAETVVQGADDPPLQAEEKHPEEMTDETLVSPKPLDQLEPTPSGEPLGKLDFILDVPLKVTVNLGSAKMQIKELLQLAQGSVVELEKMAGEPMDVLIGDKLVARGEVVVVNEKFGVRLTDIVSTTDRIENLG